VVMEGAALNGTCDMGTLDEVSAAPPGADSAAER
jgi:hypothetical protein